MLIPKIILYMQNGTPIVRLRKNGRRKNRCIASDSRAYLHAGASLSPVCTQPGEVESAMCQGKYGVARIYELLPGSIFFVRATNTVQGVGGCHV